jgi:hypothetical protein
VPYGAYHGPNKPDKGREGGSCNRTLCQASPAVWYNHGSYSWYCADCRVAIEFDTFNLKRWKIDFFPSIKHPMFETREMIVARESASSNNQGGKGDTSNV